MQDFAGTELMLPQQNEVSTHVTQMRARILKSAEAAEALNTKRAYGSQLRMFAAWLSHRGIQPDAGAQPVYPVGSDFPVYVPANADHVALWLVERLEGVRDVPLSKGKPVKISALSVALAAIKALHTANGCDFNESGPVMTEFGPIPFRRFWKGLRRDNVQEKRQAKALTGGLLLDVLKTVPDTPHGKRNSLIMCLLYAFARRRSEVIEIDFKQRGDGKSCLKIDDESATLEMYGTKTKQAELQTVIVTRRANPVLFDLLENWISFARIAPGTPLLRAIDPANGQISCRRLGVDGIIQSVRAVMRDYYRQMGKDLTTAKRLANEFTSHSGRVGFVTTAKECGAADSDVAATTLHESMGMIAHYGRQADQKKRSAHNLDGVGLRYDEQAAKPRARVGRRRSVRLFGIIHPTVMTER